jgi:hypothetical protein
MRTVSAGARRSIRSASDERRESNVLSDRIDTYEYDFDLHDFHLETIKVRDNVQYFRSLNQP